MKNLLILLSLQISFLGLSQTTTFNEGWDTEPKTILSMDTISAIVYETNTELLGRYGKLIKYKKVNDEFIKLNELIVSDSLVDFRFDGEKLHLIFIEPDQCDVSRNDSILAYSVDTTAFIVSNWIKISKLGLFEEVVFANDSMLFLLDQYGDSKLFSLGNYTETSSPLWFTGGINNDFCTGLFDGNFILTYSFWWGLILEPTSDSMQFPNYYIALPQNPEFAYSYGQDSLLVLAGDSVYKMDTTMTSMKSFELPVYDRIKAVGDQLFLLKGNFVQTLALPACTVMSSDTLKGLPSRFNLVDVYPASSQELAALAGSKKNMALNEMAIKDKIQSTDEVERHELRLDSIVPVDTTDISVIWGGNYNVEVNYQIYCSNTGTDTIHRFQLLYSDYPYSMLCGPLVHKSKLITIPPGETVSFFQEIKMFNINSNVCFYVSAPDSRLENNLNDNKICSNYRINIVETVGIDLVALYPNPAATVLHMKGDFEKLKSIFLFTPDGRRAEPKVIAKENSVMTLNLEGMPAGVYFLHLQIADDVMVKRIVKY